GIRCQSICHSKGVVDAFSSFSEKVVLKSCNVSWFSCIHHLSLRCQTSGCTHVVLLLSAS
ncbi:hypothetical protein FHQ95_26685, partial [Escherichia coli]|nr:hypothetical protein [Escherichia coli]